MEDGFLVPWRSQVVDMLGGLKHTGGAQTRVYIQRKRGRERERGRICLIVWPTLTDGHTLQKEQCDCENGPSVTLAVCVFVCVLMHV